MATFAVKANQGSSARNDLVCSVDNSIIELSRLDHAIPAMGTSAVFKQVACPIDDAHRLPNMGSAACFSGAVKLQDHASIGRLSILGQPIDTPEHTVSSELIGQLTPISSNQVGARLARLLGRGKDTQRVAHARASLPG
jgi:hypothetical protein